MAVLGLVPKNAKAQVPPTSDLLSSYSGGAYYRIADPGDITIQVSVWGSASRTGLYEVRQGMKLSTLFTLVGGGQVSVRNSASGSINQGGRVKYTLDVRLLRPQGDGRFVEVFSKYMENQLSPFEEDIVLEDGDILVMESEVRTRVGFRIILSYIAAIGSTVFLIDRIIDLAQ